LKKERDGKIGFQKNVQQIEKYSKWVILVPIQHQIQKAPFFFFFLVQVSFHFKAIANPPQYITHIQVFFSH